MDYAVERHVEAVAVFHVGEGRDCGVLVDFDQGVGVGVRGAVVGVGNVCSGGVFGDVKLEAVVAKQAAFLLVSRVAEETVRGLGAGEGCLLRAEGDDVLLLGDEVVAGAAGLALEAVCAGCAAVGTGFASSG